MSEISDNTESRGNWLAGCRGRKDTSSQMQDCRSLISEVLYTRPKIFIWKSCPRPGVGYRRACSSIVEFCSRTNRWQGAVDKVRSFGPNLVERGLVANMSLEEIVIVIYDAAISKHENENCDTVHTTILAREGNIPTSTIR